MARGVMRQTNSELNKLRMKNVINYDDEIKNAISISSKESEEEYADDRGETPYYQSFVSLYDFSHHPPRWCHSWACLDGNQIKFYVTRGESEKTLKGVATILSSTHLSRLDSQDRDFCLRLNHIKYNLQTKGSILENTITIGLFNERNASFWQRALQYAVDSCNCDTPATTEPSTPIVSAIFSPDVLPVPPPLPPRNKDPPPISSTDSPSESRKGHRKKKSKIQELLGAHDSVSTLKTTTQEQIDVSLQRKAKSLSLYPIDPEPRLSTSLNSETLRSYVSCAGRYWNHLSNGTKPEYSEPYGDFVRTSPKKIQITLLLQGKDWPTKNGGSLGDAPKSSSFFGLKKIDEEAESKKQECRVTVHTKTISDNIWKVVASTNRVRYVEGENKYKDNISIEPGAPIFPVALLVEIEESRVDETILQFRIHSVDDEETFVMSRMEIRVVELLHRATRSRRERNQVDLRSSLWPGSLGVIVVQPNSTLRLDLLPLLRPMRQSYQFKQHCIADEDEEDEEGNDELRTMIVMEETSETTLSFLIPSLYLRLRGDEMKVALLAKRERNHLKKAKTKDSAERESLDTITEMLDLMEHKIRDDYMEASGVYWRRFLCNDAFRSSKQKKDHTVKAIPVNLHVQNLLVDSYRTRVSPLPRGKREEFHSENKKLLSQLSTEDLKIRGAEITKVASSASLNITKSPKKSEKKICDRNLDRYTFVSWGSPASHTDKFKGGGTWSKRRKIHKLDRSIRNLLTKIAMLDMKDSDTHIEERSVTAKLKSLVKTFEEAQEKENEYAKKIEDLGIELDDLDVEIGDDFSGSLKHLIDVASQKTTNKNSSSSSDNVILKSDKSPSRLSKQDCESYLDELRTKRRRIGQQVRDLKQKHAALIRQLEYNRAERGSMQNQVHSKTTKLQGEILNTQLRHDTAMCHCLTATTVCLMLKIEEALKQNDIASLEQLARFGLLMHQESLLSSYDKEEGMLQDQLSATFSLDGVVFSLRRGSKNLKKGMRTRGEIGDSISIRRLSHKYSLRVFETDKVKNEVNQTVFTVLGGIVMEHRRRDDEEKEDIDSSFEFMLPTAFDLCLEPLHKLEIEVEIPPEMYDRLPISLRGDDDDDNGKSSKEEEEEEEEEEEKRTRHIRVRPLLFTQGINEAQDLQNFKHDVGTQRSVNRQSLLRLEHYISELETLPIQFRPRGLRQARLALENLQDAVRAGQSDYAKHYEILILSSDIARLLRGSRLTNCMSGKDRTGMSITLEQARVLSRNHGLHFHDDASWTRTTMLHCMICGFRMANFPQDGIKKHKGTLYLKIQIHLESGSIIKYTKELPAPTTMIAWPTCSVPFAVPMHEFAHGNSRVQIQFKEATKGFLRTVKRVIASTSILLKDLLPSLEIAKDLSSSMRASCKKRTHPTARNGTFVMNVDKSFQESKSLRKDVTLQASGLFVKVSEEKRPIEEIVGPSVVTDVASLMRKQGTRIHNCRKNIGKCKYSLNNVTLMVLPKCYIPPKKASGSVEM